MISKIRIFVFKVKLLWSVFKKHNGIYIKTCGICAGNKFDVLFQSENRKHQKSRFKCIQCGAVGTVREDWY